MLYDPKWEQVAKPKQVRRWTRWLWPLRPTEVFEINDLIGWLQTQPPTKRYNFSDPLNCAVAQYLKARGVRQFRLLFPGLGSRQLDELHPGLGNAANAGYDYTFGGLLTRLRAA